MLSSPYYSRPIFDLDDYKAVTVPDDKEDPLYDLMYALRELIKKRPRYNEANMQYKGYIEVTYNDPKLNRLLQSSADRRLFNLASVPVKVLTNHVKISGMALTDAGAQQAWEDLWNANNLDGWAYKAHHETFKLGDYYCLVWPTYEDDGQTDGDLLASGIQLYFLDPANTIKLYEKDNPRIELYDLRYWQDGKKMRADVIYRDQIFHYITKAERAKGFSANDWEEYVPEYTVIVGDQAVVIQGEAIEVNPWGELPIKHFATDLPYGVPVHEDGYGAASAISELLVAQLSTVAAQGWPAQFALEDPNVTINNAGDGPNATDFDDFLDPEDRAEQQTQMRSGPGTISVLQGISNIIQLLPADPKVFTDPVELYMSIMSVLTETPLYSFKPGGEQPSGKAREIADGPRKAREQFMKALLGRTWKEIAALALRMLGYEDTTDMEVKWAPSVMATDLDDWMTAEKKISMGVPFETVMIECGYDAEEVDLWASELQEHSLEEQTTILDGLSKAMQQLGSSVTAGIMSIDDANKIIRSVLSQLGVSIGPAKEPPAPVLPQGGINGTDVSAQLGGSGKPAGSGGAPGSNSTTVQA